MKISSPPAQPHRPALALCVAALLVGFALYASTTHFPLFRDDPMHIRWMSWHGLFDAWVTDETLPEYRPLGHFLMQLGAHVLGWYTPALMHAGNVLLHMLNSALVAALTVRLCRGNGAGLAAGLGALFFAVYPFSYTAVAWVNVFFYPLVVFLLLAMLVVYITARVRHSRLLMVLALALAFLAPFQMEYGIVAFALLGALEVLWWLAGWQRRPWLAGALVTLLGNAFFLLIWATRQHYARDLGFFGIEDAYQTVLYFFQGFTFPAAPLGGLLFNWGVLGDFAAILVVGVPVFVGAVWLMWRHGQRVLAGLALVWCVLLGGPSLILGFGYVVNSPRLLYPFAPGVALFWGAGVMSIARVRARWAGRALAAALLVGAVGVSVVFAREQIEFVQMAAAPVTQAADYAADIPNEDRLLLVNLPLWVVPKTSPYALGNFGVQVFVPMYGAADLIYAQRGDDQAAAHAAVQGLADVTPYYYRTDVSMEWPDLRTAILGAPGGVYLTRYAPGAITLYPAGRVVPGAPPPEGGPIAAFDSEDGSAPVRLWGAEPHVRDGEAALRLVWKMPDPVPAHLDVFVHLYDAAGALVAQDDGPFLMGLYPVWLAGPDESIEDWRYFGVPVPPGGSLGLGFYNPATGARVPFVDAEGRRVAEGVLRLDFN